MAINEDDLYDARADLNGDEYFLYDIANWKNGLAFKKIDFSKSGIPVIKISELNSGIGSSTAYTQESYSEDVHLLKGDLLFSWSGNPETSIDIFRFELEEGWLNQHIFKVTPKEKVVDKDYFFYLMKWLKPVFTAIASNKQTTGLGHVTVKDLKKIRVIIPSLDYQKKVVSVLLDVDKKISLNKILVSKMEEQARSIFRHLAESSTSSVKLDSLIHIKHGYAFKGDFITTEDNGNVLVTPGNFKIGGGFKENKCKFFNGEIPDDYILKAGSLIVTMTDLSKEADTLGYGAIVPDSIDRTYLHNQRIGLVQLKNGALPKEYIYWYLRSMEYHLKIVGSASGSTVKHTSPDRIMSQEIPVPNNELLQKYKGYLIELCEMVSKTEVESRHLNSWSATLLPQIISGKVVV